MVKQTGRDGLTCCRATWGCALRCCWGLRTPAAYLYWGTPRTGAAAAAAALEGRGPIVWVAGGREKRGRGVRVNTMTVQLPARVTKQATGRRLTDSLGRDHTGDLGGGGPHAAEGLGSGGRGPHGVGHVLEICSVINGLQLGARRLFPLPTGGSSFTGSEVNWPVCITDPEVPTRYLYTTHRTEQAKPCLTKERYLSTFRILVEFLALSR